MRPLAALSFAIALAMGAAPAFAADSAVSRQTLDQIMSTWPDEVRADAERLVAQFGLPDRVTSTVLVWDVPNLAQQQAMVRAAGASGNSAEAGSD